MLRLYRNLRIRHKILIMSVIIIILSSLSTLMTYRYLSDALKTKTLNFSADVMNNAIGEMDRFFGELDMLAFTTCSNGDLQKFILQNQNLDQYNYTQLFTTVSQILGQLSIPRDFIKVHVFSEMMPRPIIAQSGTIWLNDSYQFQEDDWYLQLKNQSSSNRVIIANGTQQYYQPVGRGNVVTCAYRILSRNSLEIIGYLVIDVSKSYFDNFFRRSTDMQPDIHISQSDLKPIYEVVQDGRTDLEQLRSKLSAAGQDQAGQQVVNLDGSAYLVAYGRSRTTGWEYVSLLKAAGLLQEIQLISVLFTFWFIAATILAAVLSMGLARSITTPLEKMITEMKLAKKGHLPLPVTVHSRDESGELVSNYNDMIYEINELLTRNESMAILKKEAELNALQQQINPHFIYNTLEIMIGLACEGDLDIVISVCKSLGRMLSYNLDVRKYVALQDELKHVANYISIIENRQHGRFETRYDIDPRTQELLILKFIIQPLVENSIIHGFADTIEGGVLLISTRLEDDQLSIVIADNGRGMSEETRLQLLDLPADYAIEGDKRIGISNVFKRIMLNFGANASYDIVSSPGGGTRTLLKIPAIRA